MKTTNSKYYLYVIFLLSTILHGQSPQENLNKYWDYRDRFFDKFIADVDPNYLPIGAPKTGHNLPAGLYTYGFPNTSSNKNAIYFGSETSGSLAEYMIAMVTENLLKSYQNLDQSFTAEKIYRAMNAMNRLDTLAENIFQSTFNLGTYPCTDFTNLNGFFIRTDVDSSFAEKWGNLGKNCWRPLDHSLSTYTKNQNDPSIGNQVSQDQAWNYLLGLAMVEKFTSSTFTNQDYPCVFVTLDGMARNQAKRLIKFMQSYLINPNWGYIQRGSSDYPGTWTGLSQVWRIMNPVTGENVPAGGKIEDCFQFQKHFEDAGQSIVGQNLDYTSISENILFPILGLPIPNGVTLPMPNKYVIHDNVGKLMLSTISKSINATSFDNLILNIRKYTDYWNCSVSGPYDLHYFALDHLPMLYILLHEEYPDQNSKIFNYYFSRIEFLLNAAPDDYPKSSGVPTTPDEYLWSLPSSLRNLMGHSHLPEHYRTDQIGEYNGLDYMVLFNLYNLIYKEDELFSDPLQITEDFPTTYFYDSNGYNWYFGLNYIHIGHENNWAYYTLHSKRDISSTSTINADGKVRFKGETVTLNTGFEVLDGGEFTAETNADMFLDFTPPTGSYKSAMKNPSRSSSEKLTFVEAEQKNQSLESEFSESISIFPNPSSGTFQVNIGSSLVGDISVYDSNGKLIQYISSYSSRFSIDLSSSPSGVYFVSGMLEDGTSIHEAIVKK